MISTFPMREIMDCGLVLFPYGKSCDIIMSLCTQFFWTEKINKSSSLLPPCNTRHGCIVGYDFFILNFFFYISFSKIEIPSQQSIYRTNKSLSGFISLRCKNFVLPCSLFQSSSVCSDEKFQGFGHCQGVKITTIWKAIVEHAQKT